MNFHRSNVNTIIEARIKVVYIYFLVIQTVAYESYNNQQTSQISFYMTTVFAFLSIHT